MSFYARSVGIQSGNRNYLVLCKRGRSEKRPKPIRGWSSFLVIQTHSSYQDSMAVGTSHSVSSSLCLSSDPPIMSADLHVHHRDRHRLSIANPHLVTSFSLPIPSSSSLQSSSFCSPKWCSMWRSISLRYPPSPPCWWHRLLGNFIIVFRSLYIFRHHLPQPLRSGWFNFCLPSIHRRLSYCHLLALLLSHPRIIMSNVRCRSSQRLSINFRHHLPQPLRLGWFNSCRPSLYRRIFYSHRIAEWRTRRHSQTISEIPQRLWVSLVGSRSRCTSKWMSIQRKAHQDMILAQSMIT